MNLNTARSKLLSDNLEEVLSSLRMIGTQGQLSDLQALMALFKHPNAVIKRNAVVATTFLIRENLITHFNDLEPAVRQKLGIVLQSLDPAVVDELGKDLWCELEDRRLRAVQILGLIHQNPRVRVILAKLVQDKNVKIRATAVNLLGKVIGQNDHDVILWLLNDSDKRVRANTIEALESTGNKRLVPILLRFRKDSSNRIRGNVIKALYNLGFTEIEQDLLEMLNSNNELMQASALWVISQIKLNKKSLEDIAGAFLLSDIEIVKVNARKALQALETPRAKGFLRYLDMQLSDPVNSDQTGTPA